MTKEIIAQEVISDVGIDTSTLVRILKGEPFLFIDPTQEVITKEPTYKLVRYNAQERQMETLACVGGPMEASRYIREK